jgi:glucosamine--fructose-6-phosphate aminotransferase (isomerizing)
MAEQPQVIATLVRRRLDLVERISSILPTDLAGTVLLARGSSDHAAVYGRYALELASGRPVSLAAPSLHTLYGAKAAYRGYFAVAVSQSGRTPEIVTVLKRMKSSGARCLAVTNEPDSPWEGSRTWCWSWGPVPGRPFRRPRLSVRRSLLLLSSQRLSVRCPGGPRTGTDCAGTWSRFSPNDAPARRVAGVIGDAEGLISVGRGFL